MTPELAAELVRLTRVMADVQVILGRIETRMDDLEARVERLPVPQVAAV